MPNDEDAEADVNFAEVVIVDDEADVAREIADGLTDEGYNCTIAETAPGALELIRRSPDRFAVLITDIRMPGMDGVSLARHVLALDASMCPGIVMITGHAVPEEIAITFPPGAVCVVRKPFRWDEFLAGVKSAQACRDRKRDCAG